MQQQLLARQAELAAASAEAGRLAAQRGALERQQARLGSEAAALDRQLLERLGEQTFAQEGAQATLREVERLRAAAAEREAAAEAARAALESLGAQAEARRAGNAALGASLAALERAVADKAAGVAALEAAVAAGHADVEAKARQLDALNRRYQRLVEGAKDVDMGGGPGGKGGCGRACQGSAAAGRPEWVTAALQPRVPGLTAAPHLLSRSAFPHHLSTRTRPPGGHHRQPAARDRCLGGGRPRAAAPLDRAAGPAGGGAGRQRRGGRGRGGPALAAGGDAAEAGAAQRPVSGMGMD